MARMAHSRPKELVARGMTAYRKRALERIRAIVLDGLAGARADVYLVGSCAKGDAVRSSDIDVAIDPKGPLPSGMLMRIRESLEESTVPYFIDVIDLGTADDKSRTRLLKDAVPWTN